MIVDDGISALHRKSVCVCVPVDLYEGIQEIVHEKQTAQQNV